MLKMYEIQIANIQILESIQSKQFYMLIDKKNESHM